MSDSVTIVGAGAIGGTMGGLIAASGQTVEFIETDGEHAKALRAEGLTILGPDSTIRVHPKVSSWTDVDSVGSVVVIAVKSQYTAQVLDLLRPLAGEETVFVTMQNGLSCRRVADIFGAHRTVGSLVNLFADYLRPGVIRYYYPGELVVGPLKGAKVPRMDVVTRMLGHWGPVIVSDNVEGFLWTKLGNYSMIGATSLVDARQDEVVDRERRLMILLASEAYQVALAEGVRLEPLPYYDPAAVISAAKSGALDCLDGYVSEFAAHAKPRSGVWRDIMVRHRKSEATTLIGSVVESAQRYSIAVPLTEKLLQMIGELESGERPPGWKNLTELKASESRTH